MEGRVASAAGEPNYVVLPVIDKLGALLNVDVVSAHIKHYSNVAFVLRGRGDKSVMMDETLRQGHNCFHVSFSRVPAWFHLETEHHRFLHIKVFLQVLGYIPEINCVKPFAAH